MYLAKQRSRAQRKPLGERAAGRVSGSCEAGAGAAWPGHVGGRTGHGQERELGTDKRARGEALTRKGAPQIRGEKACFNKWG